MPLTRRSLGEDGARLAGHLPPPSSVVSALGRSGHFGPAKPSRRRAVLMLLGAATGCGTVRGRGVNEVDAGEAGTLAVGAVTHLTDARVLLVRRSDGLVAFSDRCPRDACVVRHRPDLDSPSVPALQPDGVGWLRCPCCGSSFTRDGGVNGPGPAPRPLDVHPVSVVAGRVLVTTTQRQERQRDTPPPVVGGHEDGSFTNW